MIKIIIQIIALVIAILWMAEMRISFRPFSIAFSNWRALLGIILICVGAGIYYNAAYRKGWNKAIDKTIEVIDEFKKQKQ